MAKYLDKTMPPLFSDEAHERQKGVPLDLGHGFRNGMLYQVGERLNDDAAIDYEFMRRLMHGYNRSLFLEPDIVLGVRPLQESVAYWKKNGLKDDFADRLGREYSRVFGPLAHFWASEYQPLNLITDASPLKGPYAKRRWREWDLRALGAMYWGVGFQLGDYLLDEVFTRLSWDLDESFIMKWAMTAFSRTRTGRSPVHDWVNPVDVLWTIGFEIWDGYSNNDIVTYHPFKTWIERQVAWNKWKYDHPTYMLDIPEFQNIWIDVAKQSAWYIQWYKKVIKKQPIKGVPFPGVLDTDTTLKEGEHYPELDSVSQKVHWRCQQSESKLKTLWYPYYWDPRFSIIPMKGF
jgi:hypothetical protein